MTGTRSEADPELEDERVFQLVPDLPGQVLLCPLMNAPGVTLGSAIWRRPHLESAIRALEGIGEVRLSPIGGTVGPGGASWLSLLFVAHLPDPFPRPLDQLMAGFMAFLGQRLGPWEVPLERGRVAGAWCPGFSDVSVGGRKLAGLGFKLRREAALIRAIIGVGPPSSTELAALDAAHRTFGDGVAAERLSWLGQILGMPGLDREGALRLLVGPEAARPGKISW
ncbi:MAG TPA: hypothetical protein VMV23_00725 [Candidatus Nanopelagicaceae bacterium]|nr:hypothetical protein [Candidatus Nanopelagicaceae bacterium]